MLFIYKTAKFAPVWTTAFKIRAIFVHQTLLTEHALLGLVGPLEKKPHVFVSLWIAGKSLILKLLLRSYGRQFHYFINLTLLTQGDEQNGTC